MQQKKRQRDFCLSVVQLLVAGSLPPTVGGRNPLMSLPTPRSGSSHFSSRVCVKLSTSGCDKGRKSSGQDAASKHTDTESGSRSAHV